MYNVVQFTLSGEFAFFKKPDTNKEERLFTYSCVHKVILMGILGAIIGLGGYNQRKKGEQHPEFYDKLKNIKVAIVPKNENSYIRKKFHTFNNSVGYASNENGNNLVSKEQWLEKPIWEIIVLTDKTYYKDNGLDIDVNLLSKIEEYLLNKKSIYIPYLGKNEHPANILNPVKNTITLSKVDEGDVVLMDSLYDDDLFTPVEVMTRGLSVPKVRYYRYSEFLPVSLDGVFGLYEFKKLTHTNKNLKSNTDLDLYELNNKKIYLI